MNSTRLSLLFVEERPEMRKQLRVALLLGMYLDGLLRTTFRYLLVYRHALLHEKAARKCHAACSWLSAARATDYALKNWRSYLRTPRKEMDIPTQDNLGINSEILGGLSYAVTK